MKAGTSRSRKPSGRTGKYLSLFVLFVLAALLAIASPMTATSAVEQPVRSASLSQAGESLIIQVETNRQLNLSRLDRRPDFNGGKARYFCVEMTARGSRGSTRICLGGRPKTYGAVGVSKTGAEGRVSSTSVIPAKVKKGGGRRLVATFDPREAGLVPGTYTWRIADRASGCPQGTRVGKKALAECLAHYPVARSLTYRLRPIVAVGCTGGNGGLVLRGPRKHKRVALTFDDGPGPYTPGVLDVLKRHNVKATFFMLGQQVAADPAGARRVLAQGHEVANHSWDHPMLPSGSNIRRSTRTIHKVTGFRPCLFRPPYGAKNSTLLNAVKDDKMKTVNWDVDTSDWRQPGSGSISSTIVNKSRNGSIVLMHDAGGPRGGTVGALDSAISGLKKRGFELVTVTELLGNRFIYQPR